MINRVIAIMAAVSLTLGICSFGQAQTEAQRSPQNAGQQDRSSQGARPHDERAFIREASAWNNFQIQLSQWVEQRAQDQQVKDFARKELEDHQQTQQQLKQVAQSMNVNLEDRLASAQQAILEDFQKKQGAELDRAYLFCDVGGHHTAVLQYNWEARNAQNPQLKQYCEQTLPRLRE